MLCCKIQSKKPQHGRYTNYAVTVPADWVHAVNEEGKTHVEITVMLDGSLRVVAVEHQPRARR